VFRLGELVAVRVLLARALELDEAWEAGAIHEALIAIEGVPAIAGGSARRARAHFDRAVELSGGQSAFAYVTLASSVAQPARDRAEFERLLRQALAIDASTRPTTRLANLIAQKRARFLLARAGSLF
jgi:predicted anti-sigma-YlaC factor YlaD